MYRKLLVLAGSIGLIAGLGMSQAKAAGAAVRVITGGASLTSARIHELCDLGLDRLVLSMDGARDDTLRKLRGLPMSAFLGWLLAVREARAPGSMRPLVQLNFVAQRDNVHELPELVELCDDGCNSTLLECNICNAGTTQCEDETTMRICSATRSDCGIKV